jgi:hypothetical protein
MSFTGRTSVPIEGFGQVVRYPHGIKVSTGQHRCGSTGFAVGGGEGSLEPFVIGLEVGDLGFLALLLGSELFT